LSTIPTRCVVDASVGIKLFVSEPLSDKAQALFNRLASDLPADLHVPDLFYIECANILWKYSRRFGRPYPRDQASQSQRSTYPAPRDPVRAGIISKIFVYHT